MSRVPGSSPRLTPPASIRTRRRDSGHRLDLVAYVANAGAVPGQPTTGPFTGYDQPATRRFSAAALWQAMNAYYGVNRLP